MDTIQKLSWDLKFTNRDGERSGSDVECLTPERGAAGLSLTGIKCCIVVLEQDTFIIA